MSVVTQLLSLVLDSQLQGMLSSSFLKTLDILLPGNQQEILLKSYLESLIQFLYFLFSVKSNKLSSLIQDSLGLRFDSFEDKSNDNIDGVTPGMRLLGLDWTSEEDGQRSSLLLYLVCHFFQSILAQLQRISLSEGNCALIFSVDLLFHQIIGWIRSLAEENEDDVSSERQNSALSKEWKVFFAQMISRALLLIKGASLINFLHFLYYQSAKDEGYPVATYPSLLHRIAGFQMGIKKDQSSSVNYKNSQINLESRKMLWYTVLGLTSALSISMDFSSYRYYVYFYSKYLLDRFLAMKLFVQRFFKKVLDGRARLPLTVSEELDQEENETSTKDSTGDEMGSEQKSLKGPLVCALCQLESPQTPYISKCGHAFCYLCYCQVLPQAGPHKQDEQDEELPKYFYCPTCLHKVTSCHPWQ